MGEMLLQGVSEILKNEINDPRVGFVTLTKVEMSADLKHAAVWVSILGGDKSKRDSLVGLERAAPYIQRRLGQTLQLRYTPHLRFSLDESLDQAEKIDILLKELKLGPEGPNP